MGTITAVEAQHVIVTDRDGATVSITLSTDTKYEQGGAPATASALSVGTRVVVDVAGKPGHLTAIDVRIAPNAPAGTGPGTTPAGGHDQPHQH